MTNEQELNEKNEYFEYVESRIGNLEKLILKKDEELKSLILKTVGGSETQSAKSLDIVQDRLKNSGKVERVFEDLKEEETRFLKSEGEEVPSYKAEELNNQLANIEKREKMVQDMLDSLGTALAILKKRHEEVNRKEATLNREYQKLQEIEALYQSSESLDSLSTSFGQISMGKEDSQVNREASFSHNGEE
ncbi:hypothetical protein [Acetobacterium woodii]|uniref:Uncharacterized protein n=1 Tax=Acetobacterium woodii (strain ATCC 29683 / DSM 1030 / JCM 2381 / KCTC 1655 / WB1) TaxID=931626 RepID=H6LGC3_ACEWD|nr:hypothetical protein [Acetobacterium woodii]AFA47059.1 hypothetical protein Awo_c02500 [Acetobacterium woodii DSM 1030]